MFTSNTFFALFVAAATVSARVVPRATPPAGWWTAGLEDYDTYHTRYLALGCQNQHGQAFFDQCCHPLKKDETLETARPAQCIPSASASSSASLAEPTSTVTIPADVPVSSGSASDVSSASSSATASASEVSSASATASATAVANIATTDSSDDDEDEDCDEDGDDEDDDEDCEDDGDDESSTVAAPSSTFSEAASSLAVSSTEAAPSSTEVASSAVSSTEAAPSSTEVASTTSEKIFAPITTSSTSAPAPSSTKESKPKASSTKTSSSEASTSTSSSSSGQTITGGFATFFFQNGVAGACGTVHSDSDFIAAIDQDRYGNSGAKSDLCGKQVKITNTDNNKSVTVTIADDCPTCTNSNSIDLSQGAFDQIADEATGEVPIAWSFV